MRLAFILPSISFTSNPLNSSSTTLMVNVQPMRAVSKVDMTLSVIRERKLSRFDSIRFCSIARDVLITVHSLEIAESMKAASLYCDLRSDAALMTWAAVTRSAETDVQIDNGSMLRSSDPSLTWRRAFTVKSISARGFQHVFGPHMIAQSDAISCMSSAWTIGHNARSDTVDLSSCSTASTSDLFVEVRESVSKEQEDGSYHEERKI